MASRKINKWYAAGAAREMSIDMDGDIILCIVPSENDDEARYTVRVDESGPVPVCMSCDCPARKMCKHLVIVQGYWNKMYTTALQRMEVQAAEALVEQELARLASPLVVPPSTACPALDRLRVGAFVTQARISGVTRGLPPQDLGERGTLNARSNGWLAILPSRQSA